MEKPKMYHNVINKEFNNNMEVYYEKKEDIAFNTDDIRKKIYNIINSKNFIYRKKVSIVVANEIIIKKIIGISGDDLITIDNEKIPIDVIKDIYIN